MTQAELDDIKAMIAEMEREREDCQQRLAVVNVKIRACAEFLRVFDPHGKYIERHFLEQQDPSMRGPNC